jgi:predicted kinase
MAVVKRSRGGRSIRPNVQGTAGPGTRLAVLLGGPASGKSTVARLAFDQTVIVSSDEVRALAAADPRDQVATDRAFFVLMSVVDSRLSAGGSTVVDSTGARWDVVSSLRELARRHAAPVTFVEVTRHWMTAWTAMAREPSDVCRPKM